MYDLSPTVFPPLGGLFTHLLFLVEHDVGLETGHSGEPLVACWADGICGGVGGFVQRQVKLHVEGHGTLVTTVRL